MTFTQAHRVGAVIHRVMGGHSIMHRFLLGMQWFINVENYAVLHMWKVLVAVFLIGWSVAAIVYHA